MKATIDQSDLIATDGMARSAGLPGTDRRVDPRKIALAFGGAANKPQGMTLDRDLQSSLKPLQEGRHNAAFKSAKSGMRRHKSHPAFPNLAGIALCGMARHRESLVYFKKALKLDPGFSDARRNMVQALVSLQQSDAALTALKRLLADDPNDAGAWYLQAQACANCGLNHQAIEAATQAISLEPRQPRNYRLRALLNNKQGRIAETINDYEAALALNPDDVESLTSISLPLARQTRYDDALRSVSRAVELAPDHVGARIRLGMQLVEMGRFDEAIESFETLLAQSPHHPEAIEQLAQLYSADQNAGLMPVVKAALKTAPKTGEARASLCFALARIREQAGDQDQADDWYATANREMGRLNPYDAQKDDRLSAAILSRFPDPRLDTTANPVEPPFPIYVVGLPRSGTTLVESILGAHPHVKALGERATAGSLLYPLIESDDAFDSDAIASFLSRDRADLPDLPDGVTAYVDKMPENYRLLGYLKSAYPQCRIINLRRDPRDVALSMWRGHFSGTALNYTYDLAAMAHRFNLYAREMAHWHRLFPGQILDLSYENMVADVESASQRLARFCDLDWCAEMARPDLNSEQILTLSARQLRQPVHGRSVGKWRQHQAMLTPFIQQLDPGLWPGIA